MVPMPIITIPAPMTTFCIPAAVITGPVSKSALAGGFEAASVLLAKYYNLLDVR